MNIYWEIDDRFRENHEFGTKSGNIYDKTLYGPCVKMSAFFIINLVLFILLLFNHMSWKCPWISRSTVLEKLEKCPWKYWNVLYFNFWIYVVTMVKIAFAQASFEKYTHIYLSLLFMHFLFHMHFLKN